MEKKNTLLEIHQAMKKENIKSDKWENYIPVYDQYLAAWKDKKPVVVEIGVYHGGSIELWKRYFNNEFTYYGIDINKDCLQLPQQEKFDWGDNIHIDIGDQANTKFLNKVMTKHNIDNIDILIDDGGHTMEQQINTLEFLYHKLSDQGIYFCEDTHTSYWREFDGGLLRENTFIEYCKLLIDKLNSFHWRIKNIRNKGYPSDTDHTFAQITNSISFHDSIVYISFLYLHNNC